MTEQSQLDLDSVHVERVFKIFYDTKKQLHYGKHSGTWGWGDRDADSHVEWGFLTGLEAMEAAVEPYIEVTE